ncbi:12194_t:CDS:2 [Entrophospora sp. SA101]|nr:12194_t:CDS:2 [Entrophospora sp. SA101]
MHSYNPLLLPDTIATIVQKLPLDSISIALWINHTWYKEVKHELHMRCEKFKNQYWRTVSVRYMEIQLKEQCWEEEGRQFSNYIGTDDYKKHNNKMRFLDGKCNESFYKLVEVERCMLQNKLIRRRERGDVLNRINHVNNKSGWLHPWSEYEIEEMINPIDDELNIFLDSNRENSQRKMALIRTSSSIKPSFKARKFSLAGDKKATSNLQGEPQKFPEEGSSFGSTIVFSQNFLKHSAKEILKLPIS